MDASVIANLYSHFLKSSGVCTDSRNVVNNSIFFALKGDNFDGNKFAAKALESGAKMAVIDDQTFNSDGCFLVDDTLKALQNLANYHRKQLNAKIIGITGTNGKTTTKELLTAVISSKYKTSATQGNLNNQIGVPLTLLSIPIDTEVAIVEMGASHIHDIDELVAICEPDFGLITNIGRAHLGGFGSFDGVVNTKTELYRFIKEHNGKVFFNDKNSVLAQQVTKFELKDSIAYSDVIPKFRVINTESPYLELELGIAGIDSNQLIKTHLVGDYNAENVLAAITVGRFLGVDFNQIKNAIESYFPKNSRSQFIQSKLNTIIMDAYNANPSSMEQAINNFAALKADKKFAILGEMFELGDYSYDEHKKIVEQLKCLGFRDIILVGKGFNGLQGKYTHFESVEECRKYLENYTLSGFTVLVKGSRGVKLENVLPLL